MRLCADSWADCVRWVGVHEPTVVKVEDEEMRVGSVSIVRDALRCLLIPLLLVVLGGVGRAAENLHLEGVITERFIPEDAEGEANGGRMHRFEIDLSSDGRFLILVDSGLFVAQDNGGKGEDDGLVLHFDPASDGLPNLGKQRVYIGYDGARLVTMATRPNLPEKFGNGRAVLAPEAFVNEGPFPWDLISANAGILWLAYGGSDFWKDFNGADSWPALPLAEDQREVATRYGWDWVPRGLISSGDLVFPSEVTCLRNSEKDLSILSPMDALQLNSHSGRMDQSFDDVTEKYIGEIRLLKRSCPEKFARARYGVSSWYEKGGFKIPEDFEMVVYSCNRPETPWSSIKGKLSRIKASGELASYLPPLEHIVRVTDNRFRYRQDGHFIDGLGYVLEKGNAWPERDDPKLVKQFELYLKDVPETGSSVFFVRAIFWGLMLLVVVGLPAYSLWKKRKQ